MCVLSEILAFNDALPTLKEIDIVVLGISTDSQFSHLAWSMQPCKQGGLVGPDLKLSLIADKSIQISHDYGILLEDEGIALRRLFIIDPKGILCCVLASFRFKLTISNCALTITVNDLPVGHSVEEAIHLVKAF
ncbi:thioredoxin-like protein [Mycena sp. CBHHK59/15]|nr:thioredoxin-like protein [Mycena sp. CBHHK59/15]